MKEATDIEILQLLLNATQQKMMNWKIVDDDDVDMFTSQLGDDSFEIELINLQRSGETTCERALARIQSKKMYQTYAIGTDGYRLLTTILEENIFGWKEGSQSSKTKMIKLAKRLNRTITEQNDGQLSSESVLSDEVSS